jgi:hypothetical protein
MRTIIISAIILAVIFCNCNNKAAKESALKTLELNQTNLIKYKQSIDTLNKVLKNYQVELEVAKDKVISAKDFKFLRTQDEREQDIRNATKNLQDIEDGIVKTNQEILMFGDSVTQIEARVKALKEILKN